MNSVEKSRELSRPAGTIGGVVKVDEERCAARKRARPVMIRARFCLYPELPKKKDQ